MSDPGDAIIQGHLRQGDVDLDADVAIIGSGAGGSVVAAQLAEAGQRVVILEEGPFVTPEEYGRMRPSQSMRRIWRDNAMSFALGVGNSPLINVTMGRVVGGSSVLTGGVCFRTPDHVLDGWASDMGLAQLSPRALEPYFEEVERDIHVETVPEVMRSRSTVLFGEGLRKRGVELKPLRRNTRDCIGAGTCNFGCPHQSKLSVDVSYLPRALAKGARVVADCLVTRVVVEGGRAVGVRGRLLNVGRGNPGDEVTVRARRVVLAAGAWHNPKILRASRIRSRHLGRHLTLHPSFRMMARFKDPVRGWAGALQSAFSDAFMDEGITLISVFVPTGVLAATMPGFGPHHAEHVQHLPNVAIFGGLIHDEGGGTVRWGPGREPLVTYRMDRRDRATIPRLIRLMAGVFFDAGAEVCYLPILGHDPVTADAFGSVDLERVKGRQFECASQHPLGSCRMGVDAATSVVDPDGRVWGVENLYVADGSVVPTSLGLNPQVTVMAMALRIARQILDGP